MTLKEQILAAAAAAKGKLTPVAAWGVPCKMRVMTGTERDAWESIVFPGAGKPTVKENFRARLLVKVLCDDNGAAIFNDGEIAALSSNDSVELDRLYDVAVKVNALSSANVDELTKNS